MRDTKGTEATDDSTELAKDRTDWAEDRTLLANERTFAGWMRTGMAAIAIAIGLRAVFGEFDPTWAAKVVATLFLLIAIGIFWASALKSRQAQQRIHEHDTEAQHHTNMIRIAAALTAGAIGTGAILWAL